MIAQLRTSLLPALGLMLLLSGFVRAEVALFLEPDASGTVYFKEKSASLQALSPRPYPPDATNPQWMVVDYQGNYVGYVQPAFINKDLTVRRGTSIHLRPSQSSAVLTVVDDSTQAQVIELRPDWATVYYEGKAPAYFQVPPPQVEPAAEIITVSSTPAGVAEGGAIVGTAPAQATAPAAPQPKPAPVVQPAPAAAPAQQPPQHLAPSNFTPPPPVLPEERITESVIIPIEEPPAPPLAKQVVRTWEGKLVRNQGLRRLFGKNYPYLLEDASGKTIAYVVLDQALLFQPVENFWDRQVIIEGNVERIVATTPILIHARFIRLR